MSTPSSLSGPSGRPLLGETVGEALRRTVERFPEREALVSVHQGLRYTSAQLWRESALVARGLLVLGVKRGDRHRRAGREVRRGADGLGQATPGRGAHRRGDPRLLQGQDRHLQDPPLLRVRGRLPHDRLRQGAEVQDSRAGGPGARAGGGRRREDR